MARLIIRYTSGDTSGEREIPEGRATIGRGDEAVFRFDDIGLSRLNSSIYNEGGRLWIVDEGSTNGTRINGSPAGANGTPLAAGDRIEIGNSTRLMIEAPAAAAAPPPEAAVVPVAASEPVTADRSSMGPVILIAGAIFVISISAVLMVVALMGGGSNTTAANTYAADPDLEPTPRTFDSPRPSTGPANSVEPGNVGSVTPDVQPTVSATPSLPSKRYPDMTDPEKRAYIESKAMRVAQVIGNNTSEKIPDDAVTRIKSFADAYASRLKVRPLGGCRFGDNLQVTFERASRNAPFIVRSFNEKGIDPRIGLYLAMIESEHCVCLQSPTGPLGMFQFTKATGELHGLKTVSGASPSNPDERCEPEPAARAAASYMKALVARYGTGPASVPLAIGSYNSGEGGLSSNLEKALSSGSGLPRDFWTLISKGELLSKQFQAENFKYVPKFFAAAIIGENPQDFGLDLKPLSTYTR